MKVDFNEYFSNGLERPTVTISVSVERRGGSGGIELV